MSITTAKASADIQIDTYKKLIEVDSNFRKISRQEAGTELKNSDKNYILRTNAIGGYSISFKSATGQIEHNELICCLDGIILNRGIQYRPVKTIAELVSFCEADEFAVFPIRIQPSLPSSIPSYSTGTVAASNNATSNNMTTKTEGDKPATSAPSTSSSTSSFYTSDKTKALDKKRIQEYKVMIESDPNFRKLSQEEAEAEFKTNANLKYIFTQHKEKNPVEPIDPKLSKDNSRPTYSISFKHDSGTIEQASVEIMAFGFVLKRIKKGSTTSLHVPIVRTITAFLEYFKKDPLLQGTSSRDIRKHQSSVLSASQPSAGKSSALQPLAPQSSASLASGNTKTGAENKPLLYSNIHTAGTSALVTANSASILTSNSISTLTSSSASAETSDSASTKSSHTLATSLTS